MFGAIEVLSDAGQLSSGRWRHSAMCRLYAPGLLAIILPLASAQQILFTHAPNDGPPWPVQDVYSMNADGSGVKALTNDGHSHDAVWTGDGRGILYVHDDVLPTPVRPESKGFESYHSVELYTMDRDGGNRHLLRRLNGVIFSAVMSPDGKSLAMTYPPESSAASRALPASRRCSRRAAASGEGRLYACLVAGRKETCLLSGESPRRVVGACRQCRRVGRCEVDRPGAHLWLPGVVA